MSSSKHRAAVVLHGLARSASSMSKLADALEAESFDVLNVDYPSTKKTIAQCAAYVSKRVKERFPEAPLYGVSHSMGGIVLRHLRKLSWKRIVMIAPPNQGSKSAAAVRPSILKALYGPAGAALAKPPKKGWPYPSAPFAVIAGTKRVSLVNPTSWIVAHDAFDEDEDHDGTVAVSETHLKGESAFKTVHATHTTIMDNDEVIESAIKFLKKGWF
jgi:triacylglycerol lipase